MPSDANLKSDVVLIGGGLAGLAASIHQSVFRRLLPRLGFKGAIWAIAHRLGRLVWKILHDHIRYLEQGAETTPQAKKRRAQKLAQTLRKLGYKVTLTPLQEVTPG
jgi:hypothetical protein